MHSGRLVFGNSVCLHGPNYAVTTKATLRALGHGDIITLTLTVYDSCREASRRMQCDKTITDETYSTTMIDKSQARKKSVIEQPV